MQSVLADIANYIHTNAWLFQIALVVIITLLAIWGQGILYHRILPKLKKTHRNWDDTLVIALHSPLMWFIWLMSASLLIPIAFNQIGLASYVSPYIARVREVIVLVLMFWFVMRYITQVEVRVTKREAAHGKKRDKTTIRAITQLLRVVVVVITIMVAMQTFGMSITTLVAFGSVGTLAVGWAAQDTIANFIGGMMIFWDRPFSVGDWVRSPDRNIEGTVEDIGWRLTCIRTFDKRPLYVPNGVFSKISIENPSRMSNRRIKTLIGLRYDDALKIGPILADVKAMLQAHNDIDTNQTLIVNLVEFAASSLNFMVYTFTKTVNWIEFQAVQQDVFLKIIDIIDKHGAECAFPTTTLHVPDGVAVKPLQGDLA